MFGYNCNFCGNAEEKCYSDTQYLCKNCVEIKKIIDLYSGDEVVETLKYIYCRDSEPRKNRTELVKSGDKAHHLKKK